MATSGWATVLDPDCEQVRAFCVAVTDDSSEDVARLAYVDVEKVDAFARKHVAMCSRCRGYGPGRPRVDGRSAIWGGGTVGLLAGLIIGFFRES